MYVRTRLTYERQDWKRKDERRRLSKLGMRERGEGRASKYEGEREREKQASSIVSSLTSMSSVVYTEEGEKCDASLK